MRRLLGLVVVLAALAAGAPAAEAAILPGQTIDGPSADVKGLGNVDVAPDGTGAITYIKRVGGVPHVFVSRIAGGAFGPPERADTGVAVAANSPRVAASNGGKLVIAYLSNTGPAADMTARAAVSAGTGQPFTDAPFTTGNPWVSVDVDANPSGQAYAIGTENVGNTNVHAFRLTGTTWTHVGGAQLDNTAGNDAGGFMNQDQPRVGVTGDGNALAAWPEQEATDKEVYLKRLTGAAPGSIITATIPTLQGRARATTAFMVDVDAEGADSAWVAFREDFAYPQSGGGNANKARILLRRFSGGSLNAAQVVDGLSNPTDDGAEEPEVSVNEAGQGLLGTYRQTANEAHGAALAGGTWSNIGRLDVPPTDNKPFPTPAIGDNGAGLFAQAVRPDNTTPFALQARTYVNGQLGPVVPVSDTTLGPIVDVFDVAADRNGSGYVGYQQSTDGGTTNRIVGALVDGPPPPPGGGPGGGNPGPGPGGGGPAPDTDVPRVTGTKLFPASFAIGSGTPASLNPAGVRVGTTIRFVLSEASSVRFLFERPAAGRRSGSRCVKQTRRNRNRRRCRRWVRDGAFVLQRPAGRNDVRFRGRLTSRRKLRLGKHRLTLTPTDAAGNAGPFQRRSLKIVRRR